MPDRAAFRAAADRPDVGSWDAPDEPEAGVADDTPWSLDLRWGACAVVAGGSNAYPGVGPTASGSNTLRAFLRVTRKLTGVDAIG